MKELVEALCKELDPDIAELLLADSKTYMDVKGGPDKYKNWQLIENPLSTAIAWQQMRYETKQEKSA